MISVPIAAVIATIMFLCFERTRGFGVVGVFALIAVNPILFITLFLTLGMLYVYAAKQWRNRNASSK